MVSKYQTVHLDDILCGSKGMNPNNVIKSIGIRRSKSEHMETISGVDWYYYMVPNEGCISLIDKIGYEEIDKKFVVCAALPNEKNENKPIRLFAAFNSVLDFIHYIKKISKDRWYFFEYILGNQTQKLYFDIDIDVDKLAILGLISNETSPHGVQIELDVFANRIINSLVGRIIDTFSAREYTIDIARQILLFSSNSSTKRSYHIIVDGYAVLNYKENFILASEVLEGFPQEFIKNTIVDPSMYSAKQQLRLYQSQKPGSNRPKIHVREWYYGASLITYPSLEIRAPDEETAEAVRFTTLFQASCITFTDNCTIIPILFDMSMNEDNEQKSIIRRPKLWAESGAFDNFEEDLINADVIRAICDRCDSKIFEIYKLDGVIGSIILLRRKRPAHCSLCDRTHGGGRNGGPGDNAYLRVNRSGKVFFHCRRRDYDIRMVGDTTTIMKNKLVADVSDIIPANNELESNQLQSIINQLRGHVPQSLPSLPSIGPTPFSIHSQLRNLASTVINK